MKIIQKEKYTVTSSDTRVYDLCKGQPGDVIASELYVRLFSDATLVVKGYATNDDTGITLKAVSVNELAKKDEVATKGQYMYLVGGFERVEVAITGQTKAVVQYNI